MKILFIGDIFGEAGKNAVLQKVPEYRSKHRVDFVIANGENVYRGKGIKVREVEELFSSGVDVITSGNHAFDQFDSIELYKKQPKFLHPANYSHLSPSKGYVICEVYSGVHICVINLAGRIHMEPANCPFAAVDKILEETKGQAEITVVDMHAEATSETRAMGWHLNGKVAAVLGSHTHVQTADEEVLPQGTAYITDTGMTGPYRSVIGMKVEGPLKKFRTGIRSPYEPATEDVKFCAVLVDVEESSGKANSILRIQERVNESA